MKRLPETEIIGKRFNQLIIISIDRIQRLGRAVCLYNYRVKRNIRFDTPAEAKDNLLQPEAEWIDGRSLRATGRTSQLATRIKPELHHAAKLMATEDRKTLAELIEEAIILYQKNRKK